MNLRNWYDIRETNLFLKSKVKSRVNFMKIDHEIISGRVVVGYKLRFVHEVLVNCLVKLAQVKIVVR